MPTTDGGMTSFKNEKEFKTEIEELGLRFQYGCFMDKLPESCYSLGLWYQTYKENATKAMDIYKMNCETYRHANSCLKHAINLFYGIANSAKPDQLSAYEVFKRNCHENKHESSCFAAGIIMANGLASHKPDLKEALTFFEKGCQLNFPSACFHVGLIHLDDHYESDHQVKQDLEKSAQFLAKACELGHYRACVNLAIMHKKGDFFPVNESKYQELLAKAERNKIDYPPYIHGDQFGI